MKIGLFFGSFNPVHTGHLIIANHVLNFAQIDKLWFVVSPQNPFKKSRELLDAQARLELVKIAIKDNTRLEISDIEFHLPLPSYTIDSLQYLKKNFPEDEFSLIVGSDNFLSFSKWKSPDTILANFGIIVYERPGFPIDRGQAYSNILILDAPLLDISSTAIRKLINDHKSIRYLVPEEVYTAIEVNRYFR
jgi:nicotinate-nucleotide adenylyltransferase